MHSGPHQLRPKSKNNKEESLAKERVSLEADLVGDEQCKRLMVARQWSTKRASPSAPHINTVDASPSKDDVQMVFHTNAPLAS
jgi:hypothetical protein